MECTRAFDIDLAGFLAEPRADEFDAFRRHYPTCARCASEVRAWTELHEQLGGATHPTAAQLSAYETLPEAERTVVDRHAARCPACREELRLLAAFDPAVFAEPARSAAAVKTRPGVLEALARLLWHPAFAYGLAVIVIVPLLWRTQGPGREGWELAARDVAPAAQPAADGRDVLHDRAGAEAEDAPVAETLVPSAPAVQREARLDAEGFAKGEAALAVRGGADAPQAKPTKSAAPAAPRVRADPGAAVVVERRAPAAPRPREEAAAAGAPQEPVVLTPRAEAPSDADQLAARAQPVATPESADAAEAERVADAVAGFSNEAAVSRKRLATGSASEFDESEVASELQAFELGYAAAAPPAAALVPVVLETAPAMVSIRVPVERGERRDLQVRVRAPDGAPVAERRLVALPDRAEVAIEVGRDALVAGEHRVEVVDGEARAVFVLKVLERQADAAAP